jgi:hypothetical protein
MQASIKKIVKQVTKGYFDTNRAIQEVGAAAGYPAPSTQHFIINKA